MDADSPHHGVKIARRNTIVDVNPSDDPIYEAGRLLEMDATMDTILSPDTDNPVGIHDGISDGGFAEWFLANAPAGMTVSPLDLAFGSGRAHAF